MIFDLVKEGIMEILDKSPCTLRMEILDIVGARTLSFRKFCACGAPKVIMEKDPIACRRWLADMVNDFRLSFYSEWSKVRLFLVF